ncbi:MAG TPA: 2-oxoacid:ferredoxin oxidoreductase subunit beta [Bacteroidales bacterium]|nr:MAG: 2-oxoacid:ferredoxin oxidoreductase subunit beta [Bacteroidetes bacterium GWF2_33_38]OFY70047.1 MAG: 2-oxoacid:ferredoxin oxidoreductase subunit beta [Bacteroidetes bacterium RIFOXYA12_FULL_33_9]OFY88210.1 MAG: 2-oxoacid:ferredoxin oxidoreductase subunit beta [Bacteroidetes bacterium RIFOXYA2_FULL_33_7]HBF87569.1 2-oxoacid:ferredoxin oxidoreductase subunit beta [Bacteroidales bacterium]
METIENLTIDRSKEPLKKEDFVSDQMVKWCPGCGGHAILAAVANVFPKIGYRKENFTLVSGIGCSSRFPYYVNTYGFHGIHGRAHAIATGVKIANPHLSVWITSGDGDSMAIGGNHFIHIIRRNVDVNILLFNNEIYGLTKGQYSPTTALGTVTKTSPYGTIEHPFNPGELIMGAQGTFFARVPDTNVKLMTDVMFEAAKHDGTSVVEILENCVIFADNVHCQITAKDVRDDNQVILENGKPMIFGKERNKGIRLNGTKLEVVTIGEKGITEKDLLVHDQYEKDPGVHLMLAKMSLPNYPVAMGVIRSAAFPTYDDLMEESIEKAKQTSSIRCVDDLLNSGDVIEI